MTVNLADCEQDSGKNYLIPVVLTANGQSVTYTVKVQKRASTPVILNHEEGLDVKVYSQTGDYIAPTSSTGTADTYMLTLVYLSGHQGCVLPCRACFPGAARYDADGTHPCHR